MSNNPAVDRASLSLEGISPKNTKTFYVSGTGRIWELAVVNFRHWLLATEQYASRVTSLLAVRD